MRVVKIDKETTENILSDLLKRSPNQYDSYADSVQEILNAVKERGDEALFDYTEKFDGCRLTPETIQVTEAEIAAAYEKVDASLVEVIRKSLVNIREYHEKQRQYSWFDSRPDGTILGQKVTALASVGVYVPGGKAAYPSSVLMNIVPAKVAGVEKIVMVTPPDKNGEVTRRLWWRLTKREQPMYTRWEAPRRSARWHTARSPSQRWIRLWARETFMWLWPKKRCTVM